MKITLFEHKPKGRADAPPALSIRPMGQVTLNNAAVKLIEAEAGETATLGYDEESKRWILVHWPNGKAGQPELRATGANSKGSLRFQAKSPTSNFFAQLPVAARGRTSVSCALEEEALQEDSLAGASCYLLTLPEELTKKAGTQKGGNRG